MSASRDDRGGRTNSSAWLLVEPITAPGSCYARSGDQGVETVAIIGLTGGIASGKSTAAELLRELGGAVIDADKLGHRTYEPGTPTFAAVVERFGDDVVAADGSIDRGALGGKVFGKPEALKRLTDVVWPAIRELAQAEIERLRDAEPDRVVVLEAAVLLEASWEDMVDEVWVVTVDRETAVRRLMARSRFTREQAMSRIESQLSDEERRSRADCVIDNSGSVVELRERLKAEWDRLQRS